MEKMLRSLPRRIINSYAKAPLNVLASASRTFSTTRPTGPSNPAEEERRRLADQARASQNLWDFLVPEKNMSVTHPFFLVLLVLTLSLHFYNNHRDQEEDEAMRKRRLARSVEKSTS